MKVLPTLLTIAGSTTVAHATIVVETYGTAPRPGAVFGVPTDPAPFNPLIFLDVSSTPGADGALITFSTPVSVRRIGEGWATWSGGYTGNAFYTNGATSLTIDFAVPGGPNWIIAAQLYAEPNPFADFDISATAVDWSGASSVTTTQTASGFAGATGWGFYSPDSFIRSITISSDVDFAVGDLATKLFIPAPASLTLLALAAPVRRRRPATS